MRSLVRAVLGGVALVLLLGATCGETSAPSGPAADPIVVPVPANQSGEPEDEGGFWCCEYRDANGDSQYALAKGPAECNTAYLAQQGRWTSGTQCIPCCCETLNDPDDRSRGSSYERTTPKSCSNAKGECLVGDALECAPQAAGEPSEERTPTTGEPMPKANPVPVRKPTPRTVTKPRGK